MNKKKQLPIPTFNSLAEEAAFWDSHNSADFAWEEVKDVTIVKKVKSLYKDILLIELDKPTLQAIKKVAKDKGIDTTTMGTLLLRERLSQLHAI